MGSNKNEVQVSYDVSNEFFRLWLDERMNYTCAVYESENQSLEAAQLNKLAILSDFAKVTPDKRVLDIGCGWGACLEYLATARGVKQAVGVTLSSAQAAEAVAARAASADGRPGEEGKVVRAQPVVTEDQVRVAVHRELHEGRLLVEPARFQLRRDSAACLTQRAVRLQHRGRMLRC
jgi:hypothetical protein